MRDRDNIFDSMKYLSDMDFSGFTRMLEQQETFMKNFNAVMDHSANFGKDVREVVERNHEQHEELMKLWSDFSNISEDMVKKNFGEDVSKTFREHRKGIEKNLEELVRSSREDAEELYSAWTGISDSMFQGIKAGTGPNPTDVFEAIADLQQTALHIATKNIEETNESMRKLQRLINHMGEELNDQIEKNVGATSEHYEEYMEDWINSIDRMEERVEKHMDDMEKNYLSSFESYFGERSVMPLFPWIPRRRMREYESDIEDLKEKIEELEEKLGGG